MMKKIAIPTREGMVDDHFGHCAYYTVVTLDKQSLTRRTGCSDLRREWRINNYYVLKLGSLEYFPYICNINIPNNE